MTIHLPEDLERPLHAEVLNGHFANEDEAVAAIVREYFRRQQQPSPSNPPAGQITLDPVLGSMREDADLLDEIVEQAMKNRREQPWRLPAGE